MSWAGSSTQSFHSWFEQIWSLIWTHLICLRRAFPSSYSQIKSLLLIHKSLMLIKKALLFLTGRKQKQRNETFGDVFPKRAFNPEGREIHPALKIRGNTLKTWTNCFGLMLISKRHEGKHWLGIRTNWFLSLVSLWIFVCLMLVILAGRRSTQI